MNGTYVAIHYGRGVSAASMTDGERAVQSAVEAVLASGGRAEVLHDDSTVFACRSPTPADKTDEAIVVTVPFKQL